MYFKEENVLVSINIYAEENPN